MEDYRLALPAAHVRRCYRTWKEKKMTGHEMAVIAVKARELREAGKLEESRKLLNQIPVLPAVALSAKEVMGAEALRQSGVNLSAAEERYGKNWLD
jgi:hypothetical protein